MFNNYPYTDLHELNLDYILRTIKNLHNEWDDFKILNTISWQGAWNITKQYPAYSIVDNNGDGYISIKPVPAGVPINNTDYWVLVANYSALYVDFQTRLENVENFVDKLTPFEISDTYTEVGVYDNTSGTCNGTFSYFNEVYQYFIDSGIIGHFDVFDFETGKYSRTINNVSCYHGNDFCRIGSKVYCAPYDDNNNNPVNKIVVYDLDSNTTSEISAFNDIPQTSLFAITVKDDAHLICALRMYGVDDFTSLVLYEYDIVTNDIKEISIDFGAFPYIITRFPHPIHYKDGYLFISGSFENGLYTLKIEGYNAKVISYNNLPVKNGFGYNMKELEGICQCPYLGDDYLLLIFSDDSDAVIFEGLCLKGKGAACAIGDIIPRNNSFHEVFYKEDNPDLFFENGTTDYPFKDFERAECALNSEIYGKSHGNDLVVPTVINANITITASNIGINAPGNVPITFNGNVNLVRSNAYINANCTFNGTLWIRANSTLKVKSLTSVSTLTLDNNSELIDISKHFAYNDWELVWDHNPAVDENFGAQSVSLDLSSYKAVAVFCWLSSSQLSGVDPVFICMKNYTTKITDQYGAKLTHRSVSVSNAGLVFTDAEYFNTYGNIGSGVVENSALVPIRVYGIR